MKLIFKLAFLAGLPLLAFIIQSCFHYELKAATTQQQQKMVAINSLLETFAKDAAAGKSSDNKPEGSLLPKLESLRLSLQGQTQGLFGQSIDSAGNPNSYTLLISLLTLGFIYTAFKITQSIVEPTRKIVALAEAVSEGDLSARLKFDTDDEIGRMAAAFDHMSDQLEQKARLAEQIADGNLTVNFTLKSQHDVLGLAMQKMVGGLNELIGDIRDGMTLLNSMSGQISEASQSLYAGASDSAASLEEVAASMTDIDARTGNTAQNAASAREIASKTREFADMGVVNMNELIKAVQTISESGLQITRISKIIEDIAFQTNLLSLNAAVEAARAGKHGKGFAVVADEVRRLAGRSAAAAKETAELITSSMESIGKGKEIASLTSESLNKIKSGAEKTADLLGEIAAGSQEQAHGISQITIGMNQIDKVTQKNSAHAEQTASAASELKQQVQLLGKAVNKFQYLDTGSKKVNLHLATGGRESDPLKWSEEMLTGIEQIDKQHRKLVALANDLHHALKDGKAQEPKFPENE